MALHSGYLLPIPQWTCVLSSCCLESRDHTYYSWCETAGCRAPRPSILCLLSISLFACLMMGCLARSSPIYPLFRYEQNLQPLNLSYQAGACASEQLDLSLAVWAPQANHHELVSVTPAERVREIHTETLLYLCGQRFWQKSLLVRRAARCKGNKANDRDGRPRRCKAWRCRYNDQCPNGGDPCKLCGCVKPAEFQPTCPFPASNHVSRSDGPASSALPVNPEQGSGGSSNPASYGRIIEPYLTEV